MKKSIKRLLSLLLGSIMVFPVFAGCGNKQQSNTQKTNNYPLPEIVFFDVVNPQQELTKYSVGGGSDVPKIVFRGQEEDTMPIMGYAGPDYRYNINGKRIDLLNDDTFQLLEDCGINAIFQATYAMQYGSEIATRTLTLADSHKINYFVPDPTIKIGDSHVGTKDEIKTSLSNYAKDYRYFAGFVGRDEPDETMLTDIGNSWSRFKTASSELGLYGTSLYYNLLPPEIDHSNAKTNEQKVKDYLATNPDYIMFDYYPLCGDIANAVGRGWLTTLAMYAKLSKDYNVPWFGYVQAGKNMFETADYQGKTISEGEMNYLANTMLAFGAKGIAYYPCVFPNSSLASEFVNTNDHSLINEYGQKTRYYYYAQQINKQIQACGQYLLNCEFKYIMQTATTFDNSRTGNHPLLYGRNNTKYDYYEENGVKKYYGDFKRTTSLGYGILKSLSGDDAMVGCFNYGSNNAYYVMSDSITRSSATITLNFDANHDYLIIQRGVVGTLSGKSRFGLKLAAGEGAFILQLDGTNPNENDNDTGNTIIF